LKEVHVIEQLKSFATLRVLSFLTCLVLCLSLLFSVFGELGGLLIQTMASATIVLGVMFELAQVLAVVHLADRKDKVGWILHRLSYVTLVVMILSFLLIVAGTFISSFSTSGGDVMIIAVTGYVVQASFGICLSSLSYHFLRIADVWREWR
jgi:hypothetical protein